MDKIQIKGPFSNEELASGLHSNQKQRKDYIHQEPRFIIHEHPGFETVRLPDKSKGKLAYNKLYRDTTDDLSIELLCISKLEKMLKKPQHKTRAKKLLKLHYRRAVSLIDIRIAHGWNRWSEDILDLFIEDKIHKILWGSGNCGKSIIFAMLLYIKWLVKPDQRMVLVATKVVQDASARVFGYIKNIHLNCPPIGNHKFELVDNAKAKGIYYLRYDKKAKRYVRDDQACIINVPIKGKAEDELGANLLGKHPTDRLILAFDEAQELPATMAEDKIFANWYTNENLDVYAWGNPEPIDYHDEKSHDLLFRLGSRGLSLDSLKRKEKQASKTGTWGWKDTSVLHLTMLDSPKDDPDEVNYFIERGDGTKDQRLWFLGGKKSAQKILDATTEKSPTYYSQVLGFPYIEVDFSRSSGVLTPLIVKEAGRYPLHWRVATNNLTYVMGVDPSGSGKNDSASIAVARYGLMMDNRIGVDVFGGEGCRSINKVEGVDFIDSVVEAMWELSKYYQISLKNIAIETHGVGEVIRYALQRHIEDGKWEADIARGEHYHIVNPTKEVTERKLFKTLGNLKPAKDIVADINTEYWYAVRNAFESRQIFNVPDKIIQQFYSRELKKSSNSVKVKLESKADMRKRNVKSPNDADALANIFDLLREHRKFSYQFLNTGSYKEYYTPEYTARQAQKRVDQKLGLVSEILGIQNNFSRRPSRDKGVDVV